MPSMFSKLRRTDASSLFGSSYDDLRQVQGSTTANPLSARQNAMAATMPIVYSPRYNIHFWGLEKLHPFDSCKYQNIVQHLRKRGIGIDAVHEPKEASRAVLADVHTPEYLNKVHSSSLAVAQVTEMAILASLPNWLLQQRIVAPMKVHVSGTMLATALAIQEGWAINIGGGMHHAHAESGGGWCPFSDIYLAIRRIRVASQGKISRIVYIDCDAHQGNGVERDKLSHQGDKDLIILDIYNAGVYPLDHEAKAAIDINVELRSGCNGEEYLKKLTSALDEAVSRFRSVDLIIYNAGTDILVNDPLGRLKVDEADVIKRDELVWRYAAEEFKCPIVMLLSGGYPKRSAAVVTDSIANLIQRFNLNQL